MYHQALILSKKWAVASCDSLKFLFAFLILASLVSDTAACLACRLAGSLTLTAAAVLCAVAKIASLDSINMLHLTLPSPFVYVY